MEFLKVVLSMWLVVALTSAATIQKQDQIENIAYADEHNIVQCKPKGAEDPILFRETESTIAWFWQVKEETFVYPTTGLGTNKITCVRVTDMKQNGHGGYPEILTGGVDFNYVTIRMVSQRGYGFKFLIEIYGVPDSA